MGVTREREYLKTIEVQKNEKERDNSYPQQHQKVCLVATSMLASVLPSAAAQTDNFFASTV
ncbi:hypothetical protein OAG1_28320 [Agarivorans sp. OAG1]|nr:hypothetical protein OAG1_28320 [Agarivorans sp. OAG1]